MEEFPKMEPNYKYTPHIILFSAIFIFQYFTKAKEIGANLDPEQKKIGDKIFWKYMIVFQISKAADWCLGPYVFEFFESYHRLNIEWIGRLMALSFLSNLFLGPLLVGYLNDKSDKKFPCLLYGLILSASCLVRQIKSPMAIILSQIFFGMSSSVLYTSFENWFVAEANLKIKDKNVKDNILSAAFEKSMISDSLTAVFTNFIVGNLRKMYGIQAPYMFSTFLSVVSFFCISFLLTPIESSQNSENSQEVKEPENMHEIMDVIKNIRDCLKELYKQPFIILIGLTESLLFATLHIFIFSWTPTLRQLKSDVDTNEVFTMFMISLMVGGASFRVRYFLIIIFNLIFSIYIHFRLSIYGLTVTHLK
jgi:MFS transporter, MFS domain-containing protein family, molybdate-anion transporter